jgi:hypothetical protein
MRPPKKRYDIEVSLDGEDMSSWVDHAYFLGADTLLAEGDSLEELIEDATVSTSDQDGGEGRTVRLTDLSDRTIDRYTDLMRERMRIQDDRRVLTESAVTFTGIGPDGRESTETLSVSRILALSPDPETGGAVIETTDNAYFYTKETVEDLQRKIGEDV